MPTSDRSVVLLALASSLLTAAANAGDEAPSAARGLDHLLGTPYLPPDFDVKTFSALWAVWPAEDRAAAEAATPAKRRDLIVQRYGLHERPGSDPEDLTRPVAGYVQTPDGWSMNCFACHAGNVAGGETVYGLPNSHTALHSLTRDVLTAKLRQLKLPSHMDVASQYIPLNQTDGVTNAVVFGVALGASRDRDMNVTNNRERNIIHHDMDAPPWWNVRKKSALYIDGFAPKNARVLMQFMMLPTNDGPTFRAWERDYEDVLAFIESCEPPEWPWEIDESLAAAGRVAFEDHCSRCHGTYGITETYPEVRVPIQELGTDPVRLSALNVTHRTKMRDGWMSRYGADPVLTDPNGYVAPPLDGVWASGPYLHNGSVPTLWHVVHPSERPPVWHRTRDGYDHAKVGVEATVVDRVPADAPAWEARRYRDSSRLGMSNAGHDYPDDLTENEKRAVLEYLKTL